MPLYTHKEWGCPNVLVSSLRYKHFKKMEKNFTLLWSFGEQGLPGNGSIGNYITNYVATEPE